MLFSLLLACGQTPVPEVRLDPALEKAAKEQVVDMSGIPVALEGRITAVEAAPGTGAPTATVAATGNELDVTVLNAPICGAEGATVAASRGDARISLAVNGGAPCADGQTGKVTLHTTDRPGNVRGLEVAVQFAAAAPVVAPIVRSDAP